MDRDGNAEIIICANNYAFGTRTGIQVFGDLKDGWVNTRRIWNQHTYHITNVASDTTIPANEVSNWLSFNSFRSQEGEDAGEIFAAPDLTASLIVLDQVNCPDVGITARIGNGGAIVAAAPIDVAFYDGDPGGGGVLLGVVQTSVDLEPGEYEDVTLVVGGLDGDHEICVVADDDGTGTGAANECDETNNMCCAPFDSICAECFLVIGTGPGTTTFAPLSHVFNPQVSGVADWYAVLLDDIPSFPFPYVNHQAGAPGLPTAGPSVVQEYWVQVVMWNPVVFPQQPEQWTPLLHAQVLSDGQVVTETSGSSTGMDIWTETDVDRKGQTVLRFPFSIPGF